MNYRVVERDSFKTAGKIVTSSLENNIIPQFWDKCKKDGTIDKLLEIGVNTYTLGMCFGYNDEGCSVRAFFTSQGCKGQGMKQSFQART